MYNQNNNRYTKSGNWETLAPQRRLKNTATAIGMALTAYLIISVGIPFFANTCFNILNQDSIILRGEIEPFLNELVNTAAYIGSILIPFLILATSVRMPLKPIFKPGGKSMAYRLACIGLCIGAASIGNVLSELITELTALFGFVPYYQPQGLGGGLAIDILIVLTSTLGAAIIEEFAFRGVIIKLLEPFGQGFAIMTSAFLFAICHPSAAQFAPALITGLALGYVVISTGSIFTAVIAHLVYNTLALIISRLTLYMPFELGNLAAILFTAIMLGIGLISAIKLCKQEDSFKLQEGQNGLSLKQKLGALITSAPLVFVCAFFAIIMITSFVPTY